MLIKVNYGASIRMAIMKSDDIKKHVPGSRETGSLIP